ncbi:MAG: hypothetical protein QM767_22915 [Anaeromyxobacter sp.]
MTIRKDYILRMIEELATAVARAMGFRRQGLLDEAIRVVEEASRSVVGMDLELAGAVDAATLAGMLTDPSRMAALARLMLERAEIAADLGDGALDAAWRRRAVELWLEAFAAGGEARLDAVAREAVVTAPEDALSPRARALRAQLG